MAVEIPVIPKAESIFIHTGNIVNWNRLKRKSTDNRKDEFKECLDSTLEAWLSTADRDQLQYDTSIHFFDERFVEKLPQNERSSLKLTVKVMLYNPCHEALHNAVDSVMCELGVSFVETLILSVPAKCHSLEYLLPLWQQLEALVSEEKVFSLGMADLDKTHLEELFNVASVKPSINQVNLDSCCVMPPEMTAFAKENDIQLLTHNDPTDILGEGGLQGVLSSAMTERDSDGWLPCWVMRYSVVIKNRGIIKTKGYIVSAARDKDWRRRP